MPLQDIMNAPTSFGPLLSEQVQDRDLATAQKGTTLANTFAEAEMRGMRNKALRKKQTLLENFEGRTDTPEFREKMMSVDPDMVMKMEEGIRNMDKAQRERTKEYMNQVAARVEMAKTPQAWQEAGFSVPFEQRDRILGAALTYEQAFARSGGGEGTALMKNTKFLEDAGMDKGEAIDILTKTKGKSDDQFAEYIYTKVLNPPIVDHKEAAALAKQAVEHYRGKSGGQGGTPKGFQSGAGPSGRSDYSHLWGGKAH